MILDLLRSDGSIIVNKRLSRLIGLDAAVLYAELISKQQYFAQRGLLTEDGFFFNTIENMELDTTLTKYQQKKAIDKLVELKLIKRDNRGSPPMRFFKINEDETVIMEILKEKNLPFKSKKTEHLKGKKLNTNNNKLNNTKINNNKENIYLISEENEAFAYYAQRYMDMFKTDHPTMNDEKMRELISNYEDLSLTLDINEDKWLEIIDYHFEYLSPMNNGNILSFLALNGGKSCVVRYLEELEYSF
ncbi:hypothetical protein [Ureibacillus acetophenoni]|uniref:Uncharacterized protein n=1 Tax=Ureibacillus acetophenoni TaxID=614649 RepID=A0A285UER0_9BACL|nr:hypothetical protein [Ureibacillus acetophenoni]SOC39066.1 hypothetical protein SAMN05877842_10530 [Ureibacillus acetophenoni]